MVSFSAGLRRSMCVCSLPIPVSKSVSPRSARSFRVTRNTSAPCSASVRAHVGPARTRVRSRTRTPESGRLPAGSGCGGASPILMIRTAADWPPSASAATHATRLRPQAAAAAPLEQGIFELDPVPFRDGAFDVLALRRRAEHRHVRVAQIPEIAVQIHPAAIAQWVEAGDVVGIRLGLLAVDAR